VDAPLPTPDALIRPWRMATLFASLIAAIELVLLVGAAVVLLAKPIAHAVRHHAEAAAFAPAKKKVAPVVHKVAKVAAPRRPRPRSCSTSATASLAPATRHATTTRRPSSCSSAATKRRRGGSHATCTCTSSARSTA
jgi:hypothetical protein